MSDSRQLPEWRSRIFLASRFAGKLEIHAFPYFHGVAVTGDAIIFGRRGYLSWICETGNGVDGLAEGRFLLCDRGKNGRIKVRTDQSGQELLFWYSDSNGNWAVSNSFWKLATALRDALGKITPYVPAIYSLFLEGSIGKQPVSPRTLLSGVELLDRNQCVEIDENSGAANVVEIRSCGENTNDGDYFKCLSVWFDKWSRAFRALAERSELPIRFDLTGGQDSRINLSVALGCKLEGELQFFCNSRSGLDGQVANNLAQEFNLSVENQYPPSRLPVDIAYEVYRFGCLGIQHAPQIGPRWYGASPDIRINGVGGEAINVGFFPGTPLQLIPRLVRSLKADYMIEPVISELDFGLRRYTKHLNHARGMMEYYRMLRGRYFAGREWYAGLAFQIVSPLLSPELESAAALLSDKDLQNRVLPLDCLLIGGGERLASIRYDKKGKTFDASQISVRKRVLAENGMLCKRDVSKPFTIYRDEAEYSARKGHCGLPNYMSSVRESVILNMGAIERSGLFYKETLHEIDQCLESENRKQVSRMLSWHSIGAIADLCEDSG